MSALPSGTVTFLLTDIEGSTRLWDEHPQAMRDAVARHDALVSSQVQRASGVLLKQRGEGDSCFAVFGRATDALTAACELQREMGAETWPEGAALKVRMALHTGEADEREGDYFGPAVNRCARLRSVAHGGQIVMSDATSEVVRDAVPSGAAVEDLGVHRLPDLSRPEQVFQVVVEGLPSDFPPLRTLDARPNNLPIQITALVGREKDVAEARALFDRPEVRLLTLTGPGGIGKTRLGLQLAAELATEFEHGVWYVALATVSDAELVDSAIAQVLDISESSEQSLAEALKQDLAAKQMLLVLDNFEQVIGAAGLVSDLIRSCRELKVIVTSREALRLQGAQEYPVAPLSLPHAGPIDPEELLRFPASDLFVQRARAVKPGFEVTDDNAPAIAEICVRLDGLPLALELAAARVKLFPPQALLTRLQSRLKMLTSGALDLPKRHKTLRDTIAWSYELLGEDERAVLRRLSVFAGGCTIEAADAVCGEGVDVFDGVSSLVDKSLLRQTEQSDGEPRFLMLETIHEFAGELLASSGEEEPLREKHSVWFSELAELGAKGLEGADQAVWLDRLEQDRANFNSALEWALGRDAEVGVGLAVSLASFWWTRGYLREGRRWMDASLATTATSCRTRALQAAGNFAWRQGDLVRASVVYHEALEMARRSADKPNVATALNGLGVLAVDRGDLDQALRAYEESLSISRELSDEKQVANTLNNLGVVALHRPDYGLARRYLVECVSLWERLGNKHRLSVTLGNLGVLASQLGDQSEAWSLGERALAIRRELGDRTGSAKAMVNLGDIALCRAEYAEAGRLLDEGLRIGREEKDQQVVVLALNSLGELAHFAGRYSEARDRISQSLAMARELQDKQRIAEGLRCLASLERAVGNFDDAHALAQESLAFADEHRDPYAKADALYALAQVEAQSGRLEEAESAAAESLETFQSLGAKRGNVDAKTLLGVIKRLQGDDMTARPLLGEALISARDLGDRRKVAAVLEQLAVVGVMQGAYERSARLLAAASSIRTDIGAPMPQSERPDIATTTSTLRDRLGERFDPAWAEGVALSLDQAVEDGVTYLIDVVRRSDRPDVQDIVLVAKLNELRDDITGSHIDRMSNYAAVLARAVGISQEDCAKLLEAAKLHDIGKIGTPDSILKKAGPLTEDEWVEMRKHPEVGAKHLHRESLTWQMAEAIALTHHERWDGTGYPKGLKGEEIPLWGRIASIVDVFDALTTERPYKKAWEPEAALEEIERCAGSHFDPQLVGALRQSFGEILEVRRRFMDEPPNSLESFEASSGRNSREGVE